MSDPRLRYRGLSFQPPPGWRTTSRVGFGDASIPGGAFLATDEESRASSEPLRSFASRKLASLRAGKDAFEIVASGPSSLNRCPAWLLHVRFRSPAVPLGVLDHVLTIVDHGEASSVTVLSMTVLATSFEVRREVWTTFVRGVRFDEPEPKAPRIRPHFASFEPPASWAESVTYTFQAPLAAALVVRLEPALPEVPFRAFVAQREKVFEADGEILESAAALAVAGRSAHRLRVGGPIVAGTKRRIEELTVLVDGGGTAENITVFSAAAPSQSPALRDAEQALYVLLESVRIEAPAAGPVPRRALVQGASVRGLVIEGNTPEDLHAELMLRGFLPTRIPIVAPTTRAGERRFLRSDGRSTGDLADPKLVAELVYLHGDGGTVRVFLDGHPSVGYGGNVAGSARVSVLPIGSRDLSLDAEELVVGREGAMLVKSVSPVHGLPPRTVLEQEIVLARQLLDDTWSELAPGPAVTLPIQDRVGLRVTRTVVLERDFEEVIGRIERLAAAGGARRIEREGVLRFFFVRTLTVLGSASLTVELGSHVLSVDPIGYASTVDGLQRFLRKVLRGERYRVFDDATGEDVTATVERMPSFLVAATRRRPAHFTSAG